jgi:hypothetical protein
MVGRIVHEKYQLDLSLSGEIERKPREKELQRFLSDLISAILTDKSVLGDLVILECGGQFIFRSFPNALHIRIIAPRETRLHNVITEEGVTPEQALQKLERHDRRHEQFLQSTFRRSSEAPDRYDLCINTGRFQTESAVELIVAAAQLKKIGQYGMVSSNAVERLQMRNQIRLQRALTKLSTESGLSADMFANTSELVFARLLDFYGIRWEYEPRTFPLKYDGEGFIVEAFTPDFYLPDSDLYVELTTMKQTLVTKKNRKVRLLRERYPEVKIRLLYQKDFEDLLFKYKANPSERS